MFVILLIMSTRGNVISRHLCRFEGFINGVGGLVKTTQRRNVRIVCMRRSSKPSAKFSVKSSRFRICSRFRPVPSRGQFVGSMYDTFGGRDNLLRCLVTGRRGSIVVYNVVASFYVGTAMRTNFRRNLRVVIPTCTGSARSGRCVAERRTCRCCGRFL